MFCYCKRFSSSLGLKSFQCWCYVAGIHPSEKMDDDCLKHVEERKKVSWYILRKFLTRKIVGWIEEKNNLLALRPFTHLPLAHPSLIYAPPPSTLVTGWKSRKKLDSAQRRVLTGSRTVRFHILYCKRGLGWCWICTKQRLWIGTNWTASDSDNWKN